MADATTFKNVPLILDAIALASKVLPVPINNKKYNDKI
jgi:hypothetical protein